MSRPTGRWQLGLALALTTAIFWGLLPIALSIALTTLDAYTVTWYRMLTAALALGCILALLGRLPALGSIDPRGWIILGITLICLVGNFVLYVVALEFGSPTVNQVVGQISPMLLMVGGIVVFRERFSFWQWAGFALLLIGLALFFNHRLPQLTQVRSGLGRAVALLVLGSGIWAIYALAQKHLLRRLQAQQVLLLVYSGAAILLLPVAHPAEIVRLNALQAWMLVFSCANTLVAYGAFAEALRHWEAARVGATLTLTPLFTIVAMWSFEHVAPGLIRPEHLNLLSVAGALLVIGGSMQCALGRSWFAASDELAGEPAALRRPRH